MTEAAASLKKAAIITQRRYQQKRWKKGRARFANLPRHASAFDALGFEGGTRGERMKRQGAAGCQSDRMPIYALLLRLARFILLSFMINFIFHICLVEMLKVHRR